MELIISLLLVTVNEKYINKLLTHHAHVVSLGYPNENEVNMKTMLDQVKRQQMLDDRKVRISIIECVALVALSVFVVGVLA